MIDIKWDQKFEIGHPRIDFEHQVFVNLIRTVSVESDKDSSIERIGRLLMEVQKYAEFHFISEENIMIDALFPEFEIHKKEHNELLAMLDYNVFLFTKEEITLETLAVFLFEWFTLHTVQVDRRIAAYLNERR
jgi:hemerythrin